MQNEYSEDFLTVLASISFTRTLRHRVTLVISVKTFFMPPYVLVRFGEQNR
jgi:hypothetical protein